MYLCFDCFAATKPLTDRIAQLKDSLRWAELRTQCAKQREEQARRQDHLDAVVSLLKEDIQAHQEGEQHSSPSRWFQHLLAPEGHADGTSSMANWVAECGGGPPSRGDETGQSQNTTFVEQGG
ncbi:hypothetical protein GOP47_0016533 [Adiantum capillus-veneris]|uniref:Uncharacterized protein n=1 Tax=Adiantum capillus-veneris TaxID=13818 RepID=A0A9D4UHU5_ADICA|nr:hypothetical protein GOP47_0016533 [Adiantum capillus-veneris]